MVGEPRAGQVLVDGVLGILDCRAAVAVLGDHADGPRFHGFQAMPIRPRFGRCCFAG